MPGLPFVLLGYKVVLSRQIWKNMSKIGRPERAPIETMQTKAWFACVKLASGLTSAYAIGNALSGTTAGGDKNFAKYQHGVRSPSEGTLNLVNNTWPETQVVFDGGPAGKGGPSELWKAMAGSLQDASTVLTNFDPEFAR